MANSHDGLSHLPPAADIMDGDQLRNINSYEYLTHIAKTIPQELRERFSIFASIHQLCGIESIYDPKTPYGDLYTEFLLTTENHLEAITEQQKRYETDLRLRQARIVVQTENLARLTESEQRFAGMIKQSIQSDKDHADILKENIQNIDKMIHLIYANPNKAIERSADMVSGIIANSSQTSPQIEANITNRMKGVGDTSRAKFLNTFNYYTSYRDVNKTTPQQAGSNLGRFGDMLSKNYKPQTTTSLASVRHYDYKNENTLPFEYRFGTQGQFHEGVARVSPTFEKWLSLQTPQSESGFAHIYFNNLARDRSDFEGKREVRLTTELHHIEDHHPNTAVITLPADKGLLSKHLLKNHDQNLPYDAAFSRLLAIPTGTSTEQIKDFFISDNVKKALFGEVELLTGEKIHDVNAESAILSGLLDKSFKDLGFTETKKLSDADLQAVYFHFIKFELTNFIIDTLKPVSFNISCKDAIDRGGVASAYYNLMKSIESGHPMSRAEFERALHGAPTLVKGRGMNHHTQLIWNAIDAYLTHQEKMGARADKVQWLTDWRNENAPKYSRRYYIGEVTQYITQRRSEPRFLSLFGRSKELDAAIKIKTAEKVLCILEGKEFEPFTSIELKALGDSRLGRLWKAISQAGFSIPESKQEQHLVQK